MQCRASGSLQPRRAALFPLRLLPERFQCWTRGGTEWGFAPHDKPTEMRLEAHKVYLWNSLEPIWSPLSEGHLFLRRKTLL